ncbi:hypothetical protein ACGFRB_11690 [Streptomyces sp. NPDC048718]|uniref:hypothetical protein n=1 Tax=Streptomyces sp. NPDC048718 TaxID=3365587 RepID=UPI003714B21B
MTAPHREPDGPDRPVTPDLYDQWAASRLEALQEGLVDLVGALLAPEGGGEPGPEPGRDPLPRRVSGARTE